MNPSEATPEGVMSEQNRGSRGRARRIPCRESGSQVLGNVPVGLSSVDRRLFRKPENALSISNASSVGSPLVRSNASLIFCTAMGPLAAIRFWFGNLSLEAKSTEAKSLHSRPATSHARRFSIYTPYTTIGSDLKRRSKTTERSRARPILVNSEFKETVDG